VETAMNGRVVSEIVLGERKFDLLVRLDDPFRNDPQELRRMTLGLPRGGQIPLSTVAEVVDSSGPNTINRENVRRRIIVQCNTADRDLGSLVAEIQERLAPIQASLPTGYFIHYSGQFESQQSATRTIGLLSLVSLACMVLALYTLFNSLNLSLQVLAALPMAAIGAVAALIITGQSLTVASMVGFISLAGIASRNGILLIAHYLYLVRYEGEDFTPQMIERAAPTLRLPVGRHAEVVSGDTLLAPAAMKTYSSQWAVSDDVHARVMEVLTAEMAGREFERTWEIEVLGWAPEDLLRM